MAEVEVKILPDEERTYYDPLLSRLKSPLRVQAVTGKGKALISGEHIKPAQVLFVEEPLISHQFFDNKRLVQTCGHCHKFIGNLLSQLNKLATVTISRHEASAVSAEEVNSLEESYEKAFPKLPSHISLPAIDKDATEFSPVVPCTYGCSEEYCSEGCRDAALRQYHCLLCPEIDDDDGKRTDDDEVHDADVNAAALFAVQAHASNEMLLFAGKAIGRILETWVRNGNDMAAAMKPFMLLHAAPWWSIFAAREAGEEEKHKIQRTLDNSSDDEEDEEEEEEEEAAIGGAGAGASEDVMDEHSEWAQQTKSDLTEYLLDSLVILRALVKARLPLLVKLIKDAASEAKSSRADDSLTVLRDYECEMLFDVSVYERLVAALELNSLEVKIDSPVREYFEVVRRLPREGKKKGSSPYHDALRTILPIVSQIRAARSARKALSKLLEAAALASEDDEDEDDDDEEDDDDDSDDDDEEELTGDEFITDAEMEKLFPLSEGSAVFAIISTMNHSCAPNVQVAYAMGDRNAALVALREIKPDEELHINYVDIEQPAACRRADLKHYGFTCACVRCDEEDKAVTTTK